ncbi:heavy metal-associated domain-containing protein [Hydrogenimonas sp. SS33]|uniref:heavy-metal-associated domain-containing protein n=1 Tax=Hydrogenimonas leucolamina TaxID=2954236 RepID=UPI00336BF740
MKKRFAVANIRCEGCANTIRNALSQRFGDSVEVDLEAVPRIVTVDLAEEEDEAFFTSTLRKLGYPLIDDETSGIESAVMKGKSFVSCAIGKFNPTKEKQ